MLELRGPGERSGLTLSESGKCARVLSRGIT